MIAASDVIVASLLGSLVSGAVVVLAILGLAWKFSGYLSGMFASTQIQLSQHEDKIHGLEMRMPLVEGCHHCKRRGLYGPELEGIAP